MKPVTVKFSHWIPKLLKAGATTLGHTIYIASEKRQDAAMVALFKHECVHVKQVESTGNLFLFLMVYLMQWIGAGFKYSGIALEQSAYAQQYDPYDEDELREWAKWFQ